MRLLYTDAYVARGLDDSSLARLAAFGDIILAAGFNVTGIDEPEEIERRHFLDSLSLLDLAQVLSAKKLVDIGSGAGLPALVLALALPEATIAAVESQRNKCAFLEAASRDLGIENLAVWCARAEEHARGQGHEAYDVAVSRAVAALPVVAEYSLPMLRLGGAMIAMKGSISDEERIRGLRALAILGADGLDEIHLHPFAGADNRWAYVATKSRPTPMMYPRRPGLPSKQPLGAR